MILVISVDKCFSDFPFSKEIRCDCGIRNEGKRHLGIGDNVKTEFAGNHAWYIFGWFCIRQRFLVSSKLIIKYM